MPSTWGETLPMALYAYGQEVGVLISTRSPACFLKWGHVFTSTNPSSRPVNQVTRTRTQMGPPVSSQWF